MIYLIVDLVHAFLLLWLIAALRVRQIELERDSHPPQPVVSPAQLDYVRQEVSGIAAGLEALRQRGAGADKALSGRIDQLERNLQRLAWAADNGHTADASDALVELRGDYDPPRRVR